MLARPDQVAAFRNVRVLRSGVHEALATNAYCFLLGGSVTFGLKLQAAVHHESAIDATLRKFVAHTAEAPRL